MKKNAVIFLLALCMALLCGCRAAFDPAAAVQGDLDLVYRNQYTDRFLSAAGMTQADAAQRYADSIATEAEYFAAVFGADLTRCSGELREELQDILRQICLQVRFETGEAAETDNGYQVTLTVWPVDILRQVRETDGPAFTEQWTARYNRGEFDTLADQAYEDLWLRGILDLVRARMETVGYGEPETVTVEVTKGEAQGQYVIAAEALARIDALLLAY